MIREEYIRVCEEQEWDIREEEEGTVELRTTTKHEGDFSFTVAGENLPEEVFEYYQAFDVDEYVEMYLEAKQNGLAGVPNARGLVEDAEDMEARLEELAIKLSGIKEE